MTDSGGFLKGKVAFITGAARGQGRSHALRLAEEGADIVAVDICGQIESVPYQMGTCEDLAETVRGVEARNRRISAHVADVRNRSDLQIAIDRGIAELGPIDIVIANAGIGTMALEKHPDAWSDVLAVNLTGVFHAVEVALPSMLGASRGGAIVLTSSAAGLTGVCGPDPGSLAYAAAKHGVLGLMRSYANNLGEASIRVNVVAPTGVRTPMVFNNAFQAYLEANASSLSRESPHALPIDVIEPVDVSNAIVWLVSESGRYVTGTVIPVDAGFTNKN